MAKRNVVDITLPHGVTVKVDKLADRTIRTVKDGDFLQATMDVRGTQCTFYGQVFVKDAEYVRIRFGSYNMEHKVDIPKGSKVDVYRPI